MKQELMFAPVGTKTYVTPKTKYIIVHTTNKVVNCRLRELEISKRRARKYSERYELEIYRPLIRDLRIIRKENLKI